MNRQVLDHPFHRSRLIVQNGSISTSNHVMEIEELTEVMLACRHNDLASTYRKSREKKVGSKAGKKLEKDTFCIE